MHSQMSLHNSVPDDSFSSSEEKRQLERFIDGLRFLRDEHRAWAREDAASHLGIGDASVADLEAKYRFYDDAAKLEQDILRHVPPQKRDSVLKLLDEVLDEPSGGDRAPKFQELMRIQGLVDKYTTVQSAVTDILAVEAPDARTVQGQVWEILVSDQVEAYHERLGKIFPSGFWRAYFKLPPCEMQSLLPARSMEDLLAQPPVLKLLLPQIQTILLSELETSLLFGWTIPEQTTSSKKARAIKLEHPTELLKVLLEVQKETQSRHDRASQLFLDAKKGLLREDFSRAKRSLQKLEMKYGSDLMTSLGGGELRQQILETEQEHIHAAKETADQKRHDEDTPKEKKETTIPDENAPENLSLEKMLKIDFLRQCLDFTLKVKEACEQFDIPTDDSDYWDEYGVRDRKKILKDSDKYNTWQRFSRNDKHKKKGYNGFQYKWLDLKTGSNLTGAKAQSGLLYLNRFKESGYALVAFAGAFSVDWKDQNSPTYTPDEFIEIINTELITLQGDSTQKTRLSSAA